MIWQLAEFLTGVLACLLLLLMSGAVLFLMSAGIVEIASRLPWKFSRKE